MEPKTASTTPRPGQRHKPIEDVVAYAIGHRIRIAVLVLLNEGTFTVDEIAKAIGEHISKVSHHVRELVDGGAIVLAKSEMVRNAERHYYRAELGPFYTDEEVAAMTPQQRQVSAGFVIQSMFAEAMAAFRSGKIRDDPRCWLTWRWFNVDARGRNDIADEQQRHWERVQEIEAEATERRIVSGEEAKSVIVAGMGFERERVAEPLPPMPAFEPGEANA